MTADLNESVKKENIKIHVKGLKKAFGKLEVLKGIDAEITTGEVICVIGPSGSGKSTFLRCINRLEEATGAAGIALMVFFILLLLIPGLLPFHAMETVSYALFIAWYVD